MSSSVSAVVVSPAAAFLHPSISMDELQALGAGMSAEWTSETAAHGHVERIPATVLGVQLDHGTLQVRSREEGNGSERTFWCHWPPVPDDLFKGKLR